MRPRRARVDFRDFLRCRELERLEEGRPVVIQSYRLPHRFRPPATFFWFAVFPDGRAEPVERTEAAALAGWTDRAQP